MTWEILLPSAVVAGKLAQGKIVTKHNKLSPEYMGTGRVKVTMTNVAITLPGHVLTYFLSNFGRVEDANPVRVTIGAMVGDYPFLICLKREGFKVISDIVTSNDWQMRVVVEGK